MNNDTATSNGNTQQQVLQALAAQRAVLVYQIARKVRMRGQRDEELQRKAENLQAQIEQMGVQVAMKEEFVRNTTKNYADFTRFQASGIGNISLTLAQQQNWMRSKDELEELKSRSLRLQADLIETQFQQSTVDLQIDNEIDGMRSKISDLDQQVASAEARRSIEIGAPASGTVTAIASHPGPDGRERRAAADDCSLRMRTCRRSFWRPAPRSASSAPASGCRLRYSAFPYQKFGQVLGNGHRSFARRASAGGTQERSCRVCRRLSSPRRSIA